MKLAAFLAASGPALEDERSTCADDTNQSTSGDRSKRNDKFLSKLLKRSAQSFRASHGESNATRRERKRASTLGRSDASVEKRAEHGAEQGARLSQPQAKAHTSYLSHQRADTQGSTMPLHQASSLISRRDGRVVERTDGYAAPSFAANKHGVASPNSVNMLRSGHMDGSVAPRSQSVYEQIPAAAPPLQRPMKQHDSIKPSSSRRSQQDSSIASSPGKWADARRPYPAEEISTHLRRDSDAPFSLYRPETEQTTPSTSQEVAAPEEVDSPTDMMWPSESIKPKRLQAVLRAPPPVHRNASPTHQTPSVRTTQGSIISGRVTTISSQLDAESILASEPPDYVRTFVERQEMARESKKVKTASLPDLRYRDGEASKPYEDDLFEVVGRAHNVEGNAVVKGKKSSTHETVRAGTNSNILKLVCSEGGDGLDYASAMRQLEMTKSLMMQDVRNNSQSDGHNKSHHEALPDADRKIQEHADLVQSQALAETARCRQLALRCLHVLRPYRHQLDKFAHLELHEDSSSLNGAAAGGLSLPRAAGEARGTEKEHLTMLINDLESFVEKGRQRQRPQNKANSPPSPTRSRVVTVHSSQGSLRAYNKGAHHNKFEEDKMQNPAKKPAQRSPSLNLKMTKSNNEDASVSAPNLPKSSTKSHPIPSPQLNPSKTEARPTEAVLYARKVKASL